MKQILCNQLYPPGGSQVYSLFGALTSRSNQVWARGVWPTAGTFRNWVIELNTAPGAGKSWTIVVWQNGSASAWSMTIADTATRGIVTSDLAVSPGDYFWVVWTASGGPTQATWGGQSVEFESTNPNESGYAVAPGGEIFGTSARKGGVFWPTWQSSSLDTWNNTHTADAIANIVPCAGTLTAGYLHSAGNPGGGTKAYELVIYKAVAASPTSFVKQDGSGGTVDTRVTMSGSNTDGSATFSLPVAPGDRVYSELTPLNGANALSAAAGYRFLADVDGESVMGGWCSSQFAASGSGTPRWFEPNGQIDGLSSTEADNRLIGNPTTFSMGRFHFGLSPTPGASNSWEFRMRRNATDPAAQPLLTVIDGANPATDLVHTMSVANGDTFDYQLTPTLGGTLTAVMPSWSMVQTIPEPKISCLVCGSHGTVRSTHTALLNFSGQPLTVDTPYAVHIGGSFILHPLSAAPLGVVGARFYSMTNGSGKLEVYVVFPTGAAVLIAAEP